MSNVIELIVTSRNRNSEIVIDILNNGADLIDDHFDSYGSDWSGPELLGALDDDASSEDGDRAKNRTRQRGGSSLEGRLSQRQLNRLRNEARQAATRQSHGRGRRRSTREDHQEAISRRAAEILRAALRMGSYQEALQRIQRFDAFA